MGSKFVNAGVPRQIHTFTYATALAIDAAFVTLAADISGPSDRINVFEDGGEPLYLAYTASNDTLGAATTGANCIVVDPGGGQYDFHIPSGSALYIKTATGNTVASGNLFATRMSEA